ncbi:UDP-N-acetylmuramoyl-tripeptide--D-alanyl-D-alanine ligase [Vibrio sp.]|uniref:UDP-N-acetylmuramoyl-tripeptide--D-alanyl-D-alanine ligase n=1 Tax=Vibrio viridaestus TaxID=2487322 RepID=A0A3N9U4J5_9VIBR|nr:UDP-N-acetylmuramoyl-tripeptide--D-alanyl-D-alanine ligase [Vibrio viridaestus]MDC0609280.1 UDP-N-acetylmuramoyl-tripeptide--D-alanyl-D-alanine ligase [Vibrio sp.]RQW62966.1 UDP-N-acetylmuramoyl-tripeptide--D-alanyl-D-alanine ligase [Vibrio viridaestus]
MIQIPLSRIALVTGGQLVGEDITISSVSTDSRKFEENALFIALRGERFDGHDFLSGAIEHGAKAALVEKNAHISSVLPHVVVEDTKRAMGLLSSWVHNQCQTPTVAITGSCGKTTVKEMVASILSCKGNVLFTAGNFNNDIGVPLTLFRSKPSDDYAIIELGANHIGEIAYTTALVKPNIALVNNVAAAHLEGFGSIDGVKKAKGEIYQGLRTGQTAIVNLDSNGGEFWQDVLKDKKVKTFSIHSPKATIHAANISLNELAQASFDVVAGDKRLHVQLNIAGEHNVGNALAAILITKEMGATDEDICWGLSHLASVKGRVDVESLNDHIRLIDDSYNASVPAMKAAVDLLSRFSAKRWLVLGNMAELGKESLELHRQVGKHASPFNFDHVLTYGDDARAISEECHGKHFSTHHDMITYIEQQLLKEQDQQHTLLIKGANSSGMSKVVAALREKYS